MKHGTRCYEAEMEEADDDCLMELRWIYDRLSRTLGSRQRRPDDQSPAIEQRNRYRMMATMRLDYFSPEPEAALQ